jgi:SAM-dependent methyltransferase
VNRPAPLISQAFCTEDGDPARRLREDLERFYNTTQDYDAFREPNYKPDFWTPILGVVREVVARSSRCVILELGAGRTGFGKFLGDLRGNVEFHVQDVSAQNAPELEAQADRVHIGSLLEIEGGFDVIFSTFVWEHLTCPRASLTHLLRLLKPGGTLFIACPRYDFPFYLSPSIRHLPRGARVRVALWLLWKRLQVLVSRNPAFLLHCDPAVFHRPWFPDADAVHWVSQFDLQCTLRDGWELRRIPVRAPGLRGWFWSRCLLMSVAVTRPTAG